MSAETTQPRTFEPTILYHNPDHRHQNDDDYEFEIKWKGHTSQNWGVFFIPTLGEFGKNVRDEDTRRTIPSIRYLAIHRDGHWSVARGYIRHKRGDSDSAVVHLFEEDERMVDKMAFPIDPKMKRVDIEGAKHIFANANNTAWQFAHATPEDHNERLLLTEATITTVFEELLRGRQTHVLVGIIHAKPKNQIVGRATIHEHLNSFKNDAAKIARYNESQLYIGQHIQEDGYSIFEMTYKAFKDTKQKWTREKPRELNQISDYLTSIEKRLTSPPTYKRRWEFPTVFPNAESNSESEGE